MRSILGAWAACSFALCHAWLDSFGPSGRVTRSARVADSRIEWGLGLPEKVATFCRELGDDSLLDLARQNNMEQVFVRAQLSLQDGRVGPELKADLDSLDAMMRRVEGEGLYPAAVRGYAPWLGTGGSAGAQWWACPSRRCAGRGRVVVGQQPPVCAATGKPVE